MQHRIPPAPKLCCVFLVYVAYACRDDRLSSALAIDLAVEPRFEDLSDELFPHLQDSNFALLSLDHAGWECC